MQSAMIFPGQGAQSVGMLDGLAGDHPAIGETLAEASDVLGYDLVTLIEQGPAETLDQTIYTQPAVLAADVAVYRAWLAAGGAKPTSVAGHSLGEYAALVAAESLSFEDALRLTVMRARAMTNAVDGIDVAMAAIVGLDDDSVATACSRALDQSPRADGVVSPANYNSPGQVVIAGHAETVEAASEQARELGARMVRPIAVSVPSHCALMTPAAAPLAEALAGVDVQPPAIELLHNVDAASRGDADGVRHALVDQLGQPVRWVETIERLRGASIERCLECGPGRVLAGLNKRIDKTLATVSLGDDGMLEQAVGEAA